jgi:hypothetical protein
MQQSLPESGKMIQSLSESPQPPSRNTIQKGWGWGSFSKQKVREKLENQRKTKFSVHLGK